MKTEGIKAPFSISNNILCREEGDGIVPVVPIGFVKKILEYAHNNATSGHFGIEKTLDRITQIGWWPTRKQDVQNWIKGCENCQRYKIRNDTGIPPMQLITPTYFGEIWAADIAIFPESKKGNRYMLVMMEYLSKWCITAALPSFDSDQVMQILLFEIFLKIGMPARLITDNGSNFVSDAMTLVCKRLGIKRSLTSVDHPQTNGLVERMNRTLKTSLATVVGNEPGAWNSYLPFITFAYNTAKQTSTGFSPFELMYGRKVSLSLIQDLEIKNPKTFTSEEWLVYLNSKIPLLDGKAIENIKRNQGYQKKFYDKHSKIKYDYKPGDLIARKNLEKQSFPKEKWSGPWVVVERNNKEGTSFKITKQNDTTGYITTANVRYKRPWSTSYITDPTVSLEGRIL